LSTIVSKTTNLEVNLRFLVRLVRREGHLTWVGEREAFAPGIRCGLRIVAREFAVQLTLSRWISWGFHNMPRCDDQHWPDGTGTEAKP
jgi:hypothetical protein